MPETAVHKNSELKFWENEIWFAKHGLIPSPAGDALPPEHFCQRDFRVLVPVPANCGH